MCSLTPEQCDSILKSYFGHQNYQLLNFCVKTAADASLGLMSTVSSLNVVVLLNNSNDITENPKKVSFFLKFQPHNDYHLSVVTKANCYIKESGFFGTLFGEMRKFLIHKSVPECYLRDCEQVIVLEDLTSSGYKNCSNPIGFDLDHAYASIRSLADLHAASLLYEHKFGQTLDKIFSKEILRPWFTKIDGYPGYYDNMAAADIISLVIDKYFANYPENTRDNAKILCKDFSDNMQMSKKYRNVLTHQDLWFNNVMFNYKDDGTVNNAVIIDFQMYGYNPPTLDLLILIYCNTDKAVRSEYMDKLLDYYYKCLTDCIIHHKVNPNDLLTYEEFKASMEETLPTALTAAPLFLHTVFMPEQEMFPVIKDINKFKEYMEKDRSIVLIMMEKYPDYKQRILIAVQDLLDYVSKKEKQ